MPIYVYQANPPDDGCEFCRDGFEFMPRASDVTLERCPKCRISVQRVLSAPNVMVSTSGELSDENVKKHGFTVYRKVDDGVYERSIGDGGPKVLKP